MKLEILKDNKSTAARVGTIMTVPEKKGKEWIKKGYAKDLSQEAEEPADPDQMDLVEEIEIILDDEGSLDQEPNQQD